MTTVIALLAQKGGVGKSALARALAVEVARGGLNVKIADLNMKQATCTEWARTRYAAGIEPVVAVEPFAKATQALQHAQSYDVFILDTPGETDADSIEIARVVDLVVQPTGASLDDLRPAVRTFNAMEAAGIDRDKLAFVISRVDTDAEERETRKYLASTGFTVLKGALWEQPAYRQAMNAGRAASESSFKGLNDEISDVLNALISRIGRSGRKSDGKGKPRQTQKAGKPVRRAAAERR